MTTMTEDPIRRRELTETLRGTTRRLDDIEVSSDGHTATVTLPVDALDALASNRQHRCDCEEEEQDAFEDGYDDGYSAALADIAKLAKGTAA